MTSKIVTSVIRILFLGLLFIFLFYPDRFDIKFEYPGFPQADSWYVRLAKFAFWFLLIIEILRIFYYGVVKSKAKGILANIVTITVPLLVTLIFLEIIFMYIPQSHEGVLSKASQIWWEKYWKPINSLGYHDKEIKKEPGKKKILVIGDSFAAGHGLKDVNERFSNQLEASLGADKHSVYNLGMSGADTRDEAKRLVEFPVKPDVIVLEYFPNDIEKVGREKGLSLSGAEPYADLKGPMATLVKRFYLPNFIYWQLPHTGFSTFEKFVQTAYTDTTVLNAHLRDLSKMIDYRDSTGAKMYAVFIPFLFQVDKSAGYTKPVEDYLRSKGVTVVGINDGVLKIPEKERVVGKNDGHGSATLNKLIADRLTEAMKKP
ncbi:SGNH/GDSL hydrolase family protein [Dyadobacter chenwenxiniae]|uniref:SGNH/GDSL hydrolase family protein n=1 Tax=Dyadobacter chenwenxiniae TaxID=2906456 RepID=A0A9X1TNU7_9BACT|nr:SGNH/GDSL hydrolase family protein [Dyadobacter chenwenxiniae]MCF0064903.1 SGNH/GDSL hydrolase family protein [Dyadobacter chenwenxiniae]UON83025.1 SGNH/GDSL hydrolase family protein [Dyadobacter chenwenxiniae]